MFVTQTRTPTWICRGYAAARAGIFVFALLHSNCTPLRGRLRCTAVFPGVSVLSKPTPALSKCLKLKCRLTSQAGRRGFESRLPLHKINSLESPFTTFCSNLLPYITPTAFSSVLTASLRFSKEFVLVRGHAVPHLVRPDLPINPKITRQRGMSSPHHLEVGPIETDRL